MEKARNGWERGEISEGMMLELSVKNEIRRNSEATKHNTKRQASCFEQGIFKRSM